MKITFLILTILLILSCGQSPKHKSFSKNKTNKIEGTYHYIYPYNTTDLIENHFIVLTHDNKGIVGRYYGTSDEFDDNREGYLPGFFVANMNNIILKGNSIDFNLSVDTSEIFTKAIPLFIKTAKEARIQGFKSWGMSRAFTDLIRLDKNYSAEIHGDTLYFKAEIRDFDKHFIRMTKK